MKNNTENLRDFQKTYSEWYSGVESGATVQKATFLVKAMANADFDMDAYAETETFTNICRNVACYATNSDEGSEAVRDYWKKKGLIKELHRADEPGYKWASYLPADSDRNPGKHYPLLFVMHGANNPIFLAESYGYTDIAAREGLIVIIPENESLEFMDQLYQTALKTFPVDSSRVYMVGYSLGGIMTSRNAIAHPERYAAVGVGGMLFAAGELETYTHLSVDWAPGAVTEEMIAKAAEKKLPVCECMGEQEFIHILPVTKDPVADTPISPVLFDGAPPSIQLFQSKNKIASVNNWRRIAGCEPVAEDEVRRIATSSADIVTEKLGFPFERSTVLQLEGRSHFVGDCINPAGENLARFVCIAKSSHWPGTSLCEITWDFIRKFSRDPMTGRLLSAG